jgi:hypothetical protein
MAQSGKIDGLTWRLMFSRQRYACGDEHIPLSFSHRYCPHIPRLHTHLTGLFYQFLFISGSEVRATCGENAFYFMNLK